MAVKDLMIEGVETAGVDTSVEALAMRLEEARIGSIVIEEEMKPVGMVTDRDLAVRVVGRDRPASEVTAEDVMSTDVTVVSEDDELMDVTATMREESVRRLPVVNDEGTIVGIITFDDLIRIIVTELSDLASVLQFESPSY